MRDIRQALRGVLWKLGNWRLSCVCIYEQAWLLLQLVLHFEKRKMSAPIFYTFLIGLPAALCQNFLMFVC